MFSEKDMEDRIADNPETYLGEKGLTLVGRQVRVGSYIFDLLFEDRHGTKLIVEVQKGTLDRNHTYKILDYYHEFKQRNPAAFIDLMVIANTIPQERKRRLSDWGITFREIPESEFLTRQVGESLIDQNTHKIHSHEMISPKVSAKSDRKEYPGPRANLSSVITKDTERSVLRHWDDRKTRDVFGFSGRRAAIACLYARPEGASEREVNLVAAAMGSTQKGYFNMLRQAKRWRHQVKCWDDSARGGRVYKLIYNENHAAPNAATVPDDIGYLTKIKAPQATIIRNWPKDSS